MYDRLVLLAPADHAAWLAADTPRAALQALLSARRGVDAYPWKLAVAMLILGLPMCVDFRYRDAPGGELHLLLVGPILAVAGAWLALWWPVAALNLRRARTEAA